MRFHQVLHAALAGVFVVPAVTLTSGDAQGLEQALTRTIEAIESLTGLRTELEPRVSDADGSGAAAASGAATARVARSASGELVGDGFVVGSETSGADTEPRLRLEEAVSFVLGATEAPRGDGPEQDRLLTTLRRDVSRLQMVLDELTSRSPDGKATNGSKADNARPVPVDPGTDLPPTANTTGRPGATGLTTGLDDVARAALLQIQAPIIDPKALDDAHVPAYRTNEGEAYTADALRLGHAYYRAGRYAEGLVILSKREGDIEARYWTARCLEHLDRYEEAFKIYEEVVAHPDAGYLADRARSDLAFLSWKRDFAERIEPQTAPSTGRGVDE